MTRYNSASPFADEVSEVSCYQEGVDRVLWFLTDWDGEGEREGGLISDIRQAIAAGVI